MLITMDAFNKKKKPKIFVADEKPFISTPSPKKKKPENLKKMNSNNNK